MQHFDSGLVSAGAKTFPNINATISLHGQVCFDKVFAVSASPVPPDEIQHYRLLEGSTFQRGCFETCDCAIGPLDPIVGTFALVPLDTNPLFRDFAVVDVRWVARDPAGRIPVTGLGTYRVGGEVAVVHQLKLVLQVGGENPAQFDSGLVPGFSNFPRIDIRISKSGAICFDTIIDLHAAPIARSIKTPLNADKANALDRRRERSPSNSTPRLP